ncbi:hypothetical protein EVAR_9639_1 [Eumeta japonica]|uniref:Uncharacterized protein n=1 Tax=Eumeta variegata TaxID=151549 RepID=A0A4C1TMP5_EUMVA|nr:hypothetical protein EVAR_9639_1 [Eumeta japonica]
MREKTLTFLRYFLLPSRIGGRIVNSLTKIEDNTNLITNLHGRLAALTRRAVGAGRLTERSGRPNVKFHTRCILVTQQVLSLPAPIKNGGSTRSAVAQERWWLKSGDDKLLFIINDERPLLIQNKHGPAAVAATGILIYCSRRSGSDKFQRLRDWIALSRDRGADSRAGAGRLRAAADLRFI